MEDLTLYVNFVLHAIYGKLAEADAIMRMVGPRIRRIVDDSLRTQPHRVPLYRGLLLDPAVPYKRDPKLTFLSWSEDVNVARWFASTGACISEPAMQRNPKLRGYIATLAPSQPRRVLWHYLWAEAFGGVARFASLARVHPVMGDEGERQIAWALRTQREVVTEPVDLEPSPVELGVAEAATLEARLLPPWLQKGAS